MITSLGLIRDLWVEQPKIWQLFKINFLGKARGSGHSIAWNFIQPMVPIGLYILLSSLRIFPEVEGMDRLTYVSVGVFLWLFYCGLINAPMNGLAKAIKALQFEKLSLLSQIFVQLSDHFFDSFIRLFLLCAILLFLSDSSLFISFKLLAILLSSSIFFFSIGIFLGVLNLAFGDLSRFVAIILQYGIFVSGVIFPITGLGMVTNLAAFNPLYISIQTFRQTAVLGHQPSFEFMMTGFIISVLFLAYSTMILSRLGNRLRGRLL